MTVRTIKFLLTISVSIATLAATAIAQDKDDEPLLRDNSVLEDTEGRLINGGQDKWLFEFETDINEGKATPKAGEPIEMLRCAILERMVADANERSEARYRLWGKITKFEGKNYIFATYFLALRKLEKPAEKQASGGDIQQSVNSPNDVLKIPEEIMSKLRQTEVLPTSKTSMETQLKQDTIFVNRIGFVIEKNGQYEFQPDGLGRGIGNLSIQLLPCQTLEQALEQIHREPNPARFNVAGVMTRYKNEQYLLLQKATRIYSYGNLGK